MSYKVYLVEDNAELGEVLSSYLLREGWQVKFMQTGAEALELLKAQPDLWVLDIMLPDTDGFYIIRKIKEIAPNVPVIFISARDQDLDRVLGLEMGSDDYIAKPFLPRELVIRVKRLLERTYQAAQGGSRVYLLGDYKVDTGRRRVTQNDAEVPLTSKEFELVQVFAESSGRPLSRDHLLTKVWDEDYFGNDRVVDDLIRRVRHKLPGLKIETIYGQGYRLAE